MIDFPLYEIIGGEPVELKDYPAPSSAGTEAILARQPVQGA
jgi:hypothetical protein